MAREAFLSSLSVGRCFRLAKAPDNGGSESSSPSAESVSQARSVMTADRVYKVTSVEDDQVHAVNAEGHSESFGAKTLVVELAREGYERLVERAKEG